MIKMNLIIFTCSFFIFNLNSVQARWKKDDCEEQPDLLENAVPLYDRSTIELPVQEDTKLYGLCKKGFTGEGDKFYANLKCDDGDYEKESECKQIEDMDEGDKCQWNQECRNECALDDEDNNDLSNNKNCECDYDNGCSETVENNGLIACFYDNKFRLKLTDKNGKSCLCHKKIKKCTSSAPVINNGDCGQEPSVENAVALYDKSELQLPIPKWTNIYGLCKKGFTGISSNIFYGIAKCMDGNYDKTGAICKEIEDLDLYRYCQWNEECTNNNPDATCAIIEEDISRHGHCDCNYNENLDCVEENGLMACAYDGKIRLKFTDRSGNTCLCDRKVTKCYLSPDCPDLPNFNMATIDHMVNNVTSLPAPHNSVVVGMCKHGYVTETGQYMITRTCRNRKWEGNTCKPMEKGIVVDWYQCAWVEECVPIGQCYARETESFSGCKCGITNDEVATWTCDNPKVICVIDDETAVHIFKNNDDTKPNTWCRCSRNMKKCKVNRDYKCYEKPTERENTLDTAMDLPIEHSGYYFRFCKENYTNTHRRFFSTFRCYYQKYYFESKCDTIAPRDRWRSCLWDLECKLANTSLSCKLLKSASTLKDRHSCQCDEPKPTSGCHPVGPRIFCMKDGKPYIWENTRNDNDLGCLCSRNYAVCSGPQDTELDVDETYVPPDAIDASSVKILNEVFKPYSTDEPLYGFCKEGTTVNKKMTFISSWDGTDWETITCQNASAYLLSTKTCSWNNECYNSKCEISNDEVLNNDKCECYSTFDAENTDNMLCSDDEIGCLNIVENTFVYIYKKSNGDTCLCEEILSTCAVFVPPDAIDTSTAKLLNEVPEPFSEDMPLYGVCNEGSLINNKKTFMTSWDGTAWGAITCESVSADVMTTKPCSWNSQCLNSKCGIRNDEVLNSEECECHSNFNIDDETDNMLCSDDEIACLNTDTNTFVYIYKKSNGDTCLCTEVLTTCAAAVPPDAIDTSSLKILNEVLEPYSEDKPLYGVCNEGTTVNKEMTFMISWDGTAWGDTTCQNMPAYLMSSKTCSWNSECYNSKCVIRNDEVLNSDKCECSSTFNIDEIDYLLCSEDQKACLNTDTNTFVYIYKKSNGDTCLCTEVLTTCAENIPLPGIAFGTVEILNEIQELLNGTTVQGSCYAGRIANSGSMVFESTWNGEAWEQTSCKFVAAHINGDKPCSWDGECLSYECKVQDTSVLIDNNCSCVDTFLPDEGYLSCSHSKSLCLNIETSEFMYIYEKEDGKTCLCEELLATCGDEVTTPAPTAEVVLPTLPPYDDSYLATAMYYIPDPQEMLEEAMDDSFTVTEGPFGFSKAIKLDRDANEGKGQCGRLQSYQEEGDTCTINPAECLDGISVSLWTKLYFYEDGFKNYRKLLTNQSYNRYILSTGGYVEDGIGYPGFAIFQRGMLIGATVSTGGLSWSIVMMNSLLNNTWANIGLKWNASKYIDENGKISGGLQLFFDLKLAGSVIEPEITTPGAPLSPPELMVGCHKSSLEPDYTGHNSGEFDEIAIWPRFLPDNETSFFVGGYNYNTSDISPEELKDMLEKVNLQDTGQLLMVLSVLSKLPLEDETPTKPPTEPVPVDPGDPNSPATTPEPPQVVSTAGPSAEDMNNFNTFVGIGKTLVDSEALGDTESPMAAFKARTGILDICSKLLDSKNENKWKEKQRDQDEAGSMGFVCSTNDFYSKALFNTIYDNTTEPLRHTEMTKNILLQARKYEVKDWQKFPIRIYPHTKDPLDPLLRNPDVQEAWNFPNDRLEVPTNIFRDERCKNRPINVLVICYDTVDELAQTIVNPVLINTDTYKELDAKAFYYNVEVNPGKNYDGTPDPYAPLCQPSSIFYNEHPVLFRFDTNNKEESMKKDNIKTRKLLFHADEEKSETIRRHCVRWNKNISDFGAWDPQGCVVTESTADYTSCSCDGMGLFSVIAEKIDPIITPIEPMWLLITKYILYAISAILLILYCAVVIISSDLKEQFHMMGMHLCIAVLFGSISMVSSDITSIREDRHLNTAFGALIHFFYAAEACWCASLGFASFKAITSGVIGGKLTAYSMICWGLPCLLIGLPFTIFLHDLGRDPRCFISWENEVKLLFFAPQELLCCIAAFFGIVVLANMTTTALRKEHLIADYGSFCRGASLVMIYIGITWFFGYFAYMRFDKDTEMPDFYPLFQILNSLTGIIIFLLIGLGSNRYRIVLAGQAKARRRKLMEYAAGAGLVGSSATDNKILDNEDDEYRSVSSATSRETETSSARSRASTGKVAGRPSIKSGNRPKST